MCSKQRGYTSDSQYRTLYDSGMTYKYISSIIWFLSGFKVLHMPQNYKYKSKVWSHDQEQQAGLHLCIYGVKTFTQAARHYC